LTVLIDCVVNMVGQCLNKYSTFQILSLIVLARLNGPADPTYNLMQSVDFYDRRFGDVDEV